MPDNTPLQPTSASGTPDLDDIARQIEDRVSEHRRWYMFEGILFLIAGAAAIILPTITAFTVEILVAALLLMSGGAQMILFFTHSSGWRLLSGLLSLAVGAGMISFPVVGMTTLAILIGVFLILEGITEISLSLTYKPFRNWWWLMVSGILALVVGGLVFAFLPVAGMIYIALAVGINMMIYGLSLLILSFRAGQSETRAR